MANMYKIMTRVPTQVSASHQDNVNKIEFLRNAAVGRKWATESMRRTATQNLSVEQLYGEHEAKKLSKEAKKAVLRDKVDSSKVMWTMKNQKLHKYFARGKESILWDVVSEQAIEFEKG